MIGVVNSSNFRITFIVKGMAGPVIICNYKGLFQISFFLYWLQCKMFGRHSEGKERKRDWKPRLVEEERGGGPIIEEDNERSVVEEEDVGRRRRMVGRLVMEEGGRLVVEEEERKNDGGSAIDIEEIGDEAWWRRGRGRVEGLS